MTVCAPNYALEQTLVFYLNNQTTTSGSVLSGSTVSYYTGISNVDKASVPAVIVDASDIREVVPFSRNYEFTAKVVVKEMAPDISGSSIGILAGKVFNEFVNSPSASFNFTSASINNPNIPHVSIWQVQILSIISEDMGDALVNTGEFRILGAQVP